MAITLSGPTGNCFLFFFISFFLIRLCEAFEIFIGQHVTCILSSFMKMINLVTVYCFLEGFVKYNDDLLYVSQRTSYNKYHVEELADTGMCFVCGQYLWYC